MPVITTSAPRAEAGISSSVQSTNISREGAGAVAKAVSQIGEKGASLANQYLLQEKQEQAFDYSVSRATQKEIDRNNFTDSIKNQLDPSTGKIADGRLYADAVAEWENAYDETIRQNAPTDLAMSTFKRKDLANRQRNIFEADNYQTIERKKNGRRILQESSDFRSKKIQAMKSSDVEGQGSSLSQETEIEMKEALAEVLEFHTTSMSDGPSARDADIKTIGNNLAKAGVNSMFNSKKYGEVLSAMRYGEAINTNKVLQEDLKKFYSAIEKRNIDEVKYINGMIELHSDEDVVHYDPAKGTKIVFEEGIDIMGVVPPAPTKQEFEEGLILEYTTPDQQNTNIKKALAGAMQQAKKNARGILNDSQNLMAAMRAPRGEDGAETYDSARGHAFSDAVRGNVRQILSQPEEVIDSVSKVNAVGKIMATAFYSQFRDGNAWSSTEDDEVFINNSDEAIKDFMVKEGINIRDEDMRKINLQTKRELRALTDQKASQIARNPEAYILSNDSTLTTDFQMLRQAEQDNQIARANGQIPNIEVARRGYNEFKSDMDERYSQLGVSSINRSYIPKEVIKSDMAKIQQLSRPGTGNKQELAIFLQENINSKGDLAHNYFTDLVKEGLDPAFMLAAKAPNNNDSVRFLEDLADVTYGADAIKEEFAAKQEPLGRNRTTLNNLQGMAQEELDAISGYFAVSGAFNDKREEVGAYRNAITLRAASLMNKDPNLDPGDAVGKAYDYFLGGTFREGSSQSRPFFIPERVVQNLNLSQNQVDAIGNVYSDPSKLPVEDIDFMKMLSPVAIQNYSNAVMSSRPPGYKLKREDVERMAQQDFLDGKLGSISVQDEGDRMYLTVTPTAGLALRSQVIVTKPRRGSTMSEALSVKYIDATRNSDVLTEAERLKQNEKTTIDKVLEFFGGE